MKNIKTIERDTAPKIAVDLHSMDKKIQWLLSTVLFFKHSSKNTIFCVQKQKETYIGSEQLEGEYIMTMFIFV